MIVAGIPEEYLEHLSEINKLAVGSITEGLLSADEAARLIADEVGKVATVLMIPEKKPPQRKTQWPKRKSTS